MDLMLMRLFQRQVAVQCRYVLRAVWELQAPFRSPEEHFYAIQVILVCAANISKALWGHRTTYIEPRRPLRDSLGVGDTWALHDLVVRHHFEHFDQRLTTWYEESTNHWFLDMNIGPIDRMISPPPAAKDVFRHFDNTTGDVIFWGDRFNLRKIIEEVNALLPIAEREANKPHWEPPPPSDSNEEGGGQ